MGYRVPRLAHRVLGDVGALPRHVIDIHTGGIDLRFPHHEDERAQSNSLVGHDVVRHWVHGEHVLFEGRKMAKSSGNVVLLADVAERGLDPLAVRLAFLEHRYRQQLNLTWQTLEAADATVRRWRDRVADWANEPSKAMCAEYSGRGSSARSTRTWTRRPRSGRCASSSARSRRSRLGPNSRRSSAPTGCSRWTCRRRSGKRRPGRSCPHGAQDLLAQRAAARAAKDFGASDRLRADLAELGVAVTDTPEGQAWSVTN